MAFVATIDIEGIKVTLVSSFLHMPMKVTPAAGDTDPPRKN
jgi:hypothetical protein